MPDYGFDFYCADDLDPLWRTVTGGAVLGQQALHRITTTSLLNAPDYGIDLRAKFGANMTDAEARRLEPLASQYIMQDERIESVDVRITLSRGSGPVEKIMRVEVDGKGSKGETFSVVFGISSLTSDFLYREISGV